MQNYIGILMKSNQVGTYIFGPKRGLGGCHIWVQCFIPSPLLRNEAHRWMKWIYMLTIWCQYTVTKYQSFSMQILLMELTVSLCWKWLNYYVPKFRHDFTVFSNHLSGVEHVHLTKIHESVGSASVSVLEANLPYKVKVKIIAF